jgi:hypothetical protein
MINPLRSDATSAPRSKCDRFGRRLGDRGEGSLPGEVDPRDKPCRVENNQNPTGVFVVCDALARNFSWTISCQQGRLLGTRSEPDLGLPSRTRSLFLAPKLLEKFQKSTKLTYTGGLLRQPEKVKDSWHRSPPWTQSLFLVPCPREKFIKNYFTRYCCCHGLSVNNMAVFWTHQHSNLRHSGHRQKRTCEHGHWRTQSNCIASGA